MKLTVLVIEKEEKHNHERTKLRKHGASQSYALTSEIHT